MPSTRDRIRSLNDALRQHHRGGTIVITPGIQALCADTIQAIDQAIAAYNRFDEANDPYGEHDFGSVDVCGLTIFFKINYDDRELEGHSYHFWEGRRSTSLGLSSPCDVAPARPPARRGSGPRCW